MRIEQPHDPGATTRTMPAAIGEQLFRLAAAACDPLHRNGSGPQLFDHTGSNVNSRRPLPRDGRGNQADPCGLRPHGLGYLVTAPTDRRTNHGADGTGTQVGHRVNGATNDARHHPGTSCMHRRGHTSDPVDQQDRSAVRNQNCQRAVGRGGHEGVRVRRHSLPRPVHDHDVRAMSLVHEQQPISSHTKGGGHERSVGLDQEWIVAHVSAKIQAGEVTHARSAPHRGESPVDTPTISRRNLLTPMEHAVHASRAGSALLVCPTSRSRPRCCSKF